MSKLYKTIFLYVLCISYNAYAVQNDPSVVLDNFWYLHSLTIEGEEIIPPINEEIQHIPFFFEGGNPEEEPPFIVTSVCNEIIATGDVSSDDIFIFFDNPLPFIDCQLQENIDYDTLYFDFLGSATEFPYDLLIEGINLQLTLTAPNGDQAVYGNQTLSVQEVKTISFQVYPNPVQDFLYVEALGVSVEKISMYSATGKEVKKVSSQETIDVRGLSKGIYFVVITSNQDSTIKKIIVE